MSARTTIVIGAGSSGAVIAGRLSEDPDEHVILLEAGPDYAAVEDLPAPLRDPLNPQLTGHDWGLTGYPVEPPGERAEVPYARGKVVGGSSMVNGTVARRGTPEDFDDWAAAGNPSWSWDAVLPFFRKLETDTDYGSTDLHGGDGPVPVMRFPRDQWPPFMRAFEQASADRGFPFVEDQNAPGTMGFGALPRNQWDGLRANASLTHLQEARGRPNFELHPLTLVRRILFDGTRATGVEIESDGAISEIEADRLVLSGGVMHSPHLLMLSGIGPRDQLERAGVEVVAELSGVGRNLFDHSYVPVVGFASDPAPPLCGVRTELKYSSDGGDRNDILVVPTLLERNAIQLDLQSDISALIVIAIMLARPKSSGWVELVSGDPRVAPELHLNSLAEPEDVERLAGALRLIFGMCTSQPLSDEIGGLLSPAPEDVEDDERLHAWLRQNVGFGYHATSTCRMGPAGDAGAVVDESLAVHGIGGLFVADASVMPRIPTGWTSLTCMMVGEKAADLLSRG